MRFHLYPKLERNCPIVVKIMKSLYSLSIKQALTEK